MSVVAVALVLGALVVLLLRTSRLGPRVGCGVRAVRTGDGLDPAGPTVQAAMDSTGSWVWVQVASL